MAFRILRKEPALTPRKCLLPRAGVALPRNPGRQSIRLARPPPPRLHLAEADGSIQSAIVFAAVGLGVVGALGFGAHYLRNSVSLPGSVTGLGLKRPPGPERSLYLADKRSILACSLT